MKRQQLRSVSISGIARPWLLFACAMACGLLFSQCKPPGATSADLANIEGVNASGQSATLSLLPVRNFSIAKFSGGGAASQAEAMAKSRFFALVECVSVVGAKGDRLSASQLMAALEMRAAIDDLYVDEYRNLLTSKSDDALAEFGSADRKLVKVPCRIYGRRLLSWPVLVDIQIRAAGFPRKLPSGAAGKRVESIYQLAQAMHLSMRGSYSKEPKYDFMARLPAIMGMLMEQGGASPKFKEVVSRIKAADRIYNVCDTRPNAKGPMPYADQLKKKSYSCSSTSRSGVFNYRAGAGGKGYETVRNLLAKEIEATHDAVFPESAGHDDALFALWDLLTSTSAYPQNGKSLRGKLGRYLAKGSGLDWGKTFSSGTKSVSHGATYDSKHIAAPLALGIPKDTDSRVKLIVRAKSVDPDGSVLEGGSASTADNRPRNAKGRIERLGKFIGSGGSSKLATLRSEINGSLQVIRKR